MGGGGATARGATGDGYGSLASLAVGEEGEVSAELEAEMQELFKSIDADGSGEY